MIKLQLQKYFLHQFNSIKSFNDDIFVVDYTEQTKYLSNRKSVEFNSQYPPSDIEYFCIKNAPKLTVDGINFDNKSFLYTNGSPKSQCEAVFFPSTSTISTWVLFCELKYNLPKRNIIRLEKAIKQLIKSRYYYVQEDIITKTNTCYLIASLPKQSEPFANFYLAPQYLAKLKQKRNIILRLKNSVEIMNELIVQV